MFRILSHTCLSYRSATHPVHVGLNSEVTYDLVGSEKIYESQRLSQEDGCALSPFLPPKKESKEKAERGFGNCSSLVECLPGIPRVRGRIRNKDGWSGAYKPLAPRR